MLPFIEWQTTTAYLKDPPEGYTEPAVDLKEGFAAVIANISSGVYETEYQFQASLWKVVNSAHDGHFRFLPDLLYVISQVESALLREIQVKSYRFQKTSSIGIC